jgi:hypothetical protein
VRAWRLTIHERFDAVQRRYYSMARHLQRACKSMNSDVHYTDSKY